MPRSPPKGEVKRSPPKGEVNDRLFCASTTKRNEKMGRFSNIDCDIIPL
jgi:hypothetical protein